jgi:hypothetical protein
VLLRLIQLCDPSYSIFRDETGRDNGVVSLGLKGL